MRKAKPDNLGPVSTSSFVRQPSIKEKACQQATKEGFRCRLESQVLMFLYDNYTKEYEAKIRAWLNEHYSCDDKHNGNIMFSFGFRKYTGKDYDSNPTTSPLNKETRSEIIEENEE